MKNKTFVYTDELNDEFSGIKRNTITIDDNYKYIRHNPLWKVCEFFVYRLFILPFAYIYIKLKFHHKVINLQAIRDYKKSNYFVYCNHTMLAGDAFIPSIISHPHKSYTIVHPDNISVKAAKPIIEMCGAIPTPSTISATKNFLKAIEYHSHKQPIVIFPEAHIWPYYTGIRPFKSVSFKYPVKFNLPIFVLTNTFHKKKFSKTPQVITYIDGPFFPNTKLPPREQANNLRDIAYTTMCNRAKSNTYCVHTYKQGVPQHD